MYGNMNFPGVLGERLVSSSSKIERSVSAAIIPPIECATRTVRTDGSIIGDGVSAATSISITRFCNHSRNLDTDRERSPRVS